MSSLRDTNIINLEPNYFGAVIVEPRRHPALKFVLQNVLDCTPIGTQVIWFHGTTTKDWAQQIQQELGVERVLLRCCGKPNLRITDYNALLTSTNFWQSIPFQKILIFQTDSMILAKDRNAVLPFLKYAYIGAPCWNMGKLKNGGFSLRDKNFCLDVIRHTRNIGGNEDVKFTAQLYNKKFSYVIPTEEECQKFSLEYIYAGEAFGCHKPWRIKQPINWQSVTNIYPELRTLYHLQLPTTVSVKRPMTIQWNTLVHRHRVQQNRQIRRVHVVRMKSKIPSNIRPNSKQAKIRQTKNRRNHKNIRIFRKKLH